MFTVINWESAETQPLVRYGPRIIAFLGYNPLPAPTTFSERVFDLRWRTGLTQRRLAEQLGVDETTVRDWEREEYEPSRRLRGKFKRLYARHLGNEGTPPQRLASGG